MTPKDRTSKRGNFSNLLNMYSQTVVKQNREYNFEKKDVVCQLFGIVLDECNNRVFNHKANSVLFDSILF